MTRWDIIASIAGIALVVLPHGWRFITHGITLVHELGHALVGILTGAQISSIKINRDSSGVTTSAHPLKNIALTRSLTTFWGYPFPLLFAGALVLMSATIGSRWAWWAVLILGVVCLVFIRNFFGLMVTGIWIGASALLLWKTVDGIIADSLLWLLVAVLFAGGVRDFWNLTRLYMKRRDEGSDIQALKQVTHIPAVIWLGLMWITGCVVIPCLLWFLLLR